MMNPSSQSTKRNAAPANKTEYNYDMTNPYEYFNKSKQSATASTTSSYANSLLNTVNNKVKWYENDEYQGKFVYKIEKSIPAVVQKILEEMGFAEWDENIHNEDQWNILWKNQR